MKKGVKTMKQRRNKSNGFARHMWMLPVFLVAVVILVVVASAPQVWARGGKYRWYRQKVEFAETAIFFEFNSTDLDLGLHIFWDAEGWEEVEVKDPDGDEIFEVENGGGLSKIGSTEVFTESAEPPLCPEDADEEDCDVEAAIEEFQNKFQEGEYKFRGRTVDGKRLKGSATLMYALPAAPEITSPDEPEDDEAPAPGSIVEIVWTDTSEAGDEEIVGWEVVAEAVIEVDGEERVFLNTGTFPAGTTTFTVSTQFVALVGDAGEDLKELKAEVIAIGANGNKTITEVVVVEEE